MPTRHQSIPMRSGAHRQHRCPLSLAFRHAPRAESCARGTQASGRGRSARRAAEAPGQARPSRCVVTCRQRSPAFSAVCLSINLSGNRRTHRLPRSGIPSGSHRVPRLPMSLRASVRTFDKSSAWVERPRPGRWSKLGYAHASSTVALRWHRANGDCTQGVGPSMVTRSMRPSRQPVSSSLACPTNMWATFESAGRMP